jgi:DNA-nicking Smr family endonuclease
MRRRASSPAPAPAEAGARDASFREAVRGVRPLPPVATVPRPAGPPPRARFRRADERSVLEESMQPSPGELLLDHGDELSFRRAPVSVRVLERLRRGEFAVEEEIDLHGLTALQARQALRDFLAAALRADRRCVRVVHGKGLRSGERGPVLKHAVNGWLRKVDAVVAFASAPRRGGGTGAVNVLLASR